MRWNIEFIFILLFFSFILKVQVLKCLSVVISSQDGEGPSTDVIVVNDFIYSL